MGGTGYGKAGLETLAMGIPTITNMTEEYTGWLPENPFIVANNENELYNKLNDLLENKNYREQLGERGKQWVEKYHHSIILNQCFIIIDSLIKGAIHTFAEVMPNIDFL